MVLGTTKILLRITMGDEFGVYRINEGKQRYLILAFEEQEEAVKCGRLLASFLHVRLNNHFPAKTPSGELEKVKQEEPRRTKAKKVMGIKKDCLKLIQEQMVDEVILDVLTQKYIAAGRSESESRKFAKWVLLDVKKYSNKVTSQ